MKTPIILCSALLTFLCAFTSAASAATPETKVAQSTPETTTSVAPRRHQRATGDARYCLELPNNTAIVRCAEKFR